MVGSVSAVVELHRTADALVVGRTEAVEGAQRVQTGAAVLTAQLGALQPLTLVHVLIAVRALKRSFANVNKDIWSRSNQNNKRRT